MCSSPPEMLGFDEVAKAGSLIKRALAFGTMVASTSVQYGTWHEELQKVGLKPEPFFLAKSSKHGQRAAGLHHSMMDVMVVAGNQQAAHRLVLWDNEVRDCHSNCYTSNSNCYCYYNYYTNILPNASKWTDTLLALPTCRRTPENGSLKASCRHTAIMTTSWRCPQLPRMP
jgi:hypothetical protein